MNEYFRHEVRTSEVHLPGAVRLRCIIHEKAQDSDGLHQLLVHSSLYLPELSEWTEDMQQAFQGVADGSLHPKSAMHILGFTKHAPLSDFHLSRFEALFQTGVKVIMPDVPLLHEITDIKQTIFSPISIIPGADGEACIRLNCSSTQLIAHFKKYFLQEEQYTYLREQYMADRIMDIILSSSNSGGLHSLDFVLAEVGVMHYGLIHFLKSRGIQAVGITPSGLTETLIAQQHIREHFRAQNGDIDEDLLYRMIFQFVLESVFEQWNTYSHMLPDNRFARYHDTAWSIGPEDAIRIVYAIVSKQNGRLPIAREVFRSEGISLLE